MLLVKWCAVEIKIRASVEADILKLKDHLRDEDKQEVLAAGNETCEYALRQSFARSTVRLSLDINGDLSAMFGIVPDSLLGHSANVWMLGAPGMKRIRKTFVKKSREMIADFVRMYPVLWNVVDSRYVSSIRWLKSCGAQFSNNPIKIGGVDFYRFEIRGA